MGGIQFHFPVLVNCFSHAQFSIYPSIFMDRFFQYHLLAMNCLQQIIGDTEKSVGELLQSITTIVLVEGIRLMKEMKPSVIPK